MDKVFQVFISSTFADLENERQQLSNTLAKAGYLVAGMELFPASDQQQFEYIKRVIDRSDYYIVIVAGRYGSLAGDEGISFTEKEFDYARAKGIPVLAFPHRNPRDLAVNKTDEDPSKAALLDAFRAKVSTGRIVDFWSDANDLCLRVVVSVANAANLTPGVGWVRGDQAIDPKVLQEAEKLRIEVAELRQRLNANDEITFDPNILGPNDSITFAFEPSGPGPVPPIYEVEITLGEIFLACYDDILAQRRENEMVYSIGQAAAKKKRLSGEFSYTPKIDITATRNQLEAQGLIRCISIPVGTHGILVRAWSVTDKGRRFALSMLATKKIEGLKQEE